MISTMHTLSMCLVGSGGDEYCLDVKLVFFLNFICLCVLFKFTFIFFPFLLTPVQRCCKNDGYRRTCTQHPQFHWYHAVLGQVTCPTNVGTFTTSERRSESVSFCHHHHHHHNEHLDFFSACFLSIISVMLKQIYKNEQVNPVLIWTSNLEISNYLTYP